MPTDDVLADAPLPVSIDEAAGVLDSEYGIADAELVPLPGDRDRNFVAHTSNGSYMLKISHPAAPIAVLVEQQQVLDHVRLWDPTLPVPRPISTQQGTSTATVSVAAGQTTARLTTFIPGTTIEDHGWTPALCRDAAETVARLGLALRSFAGTASGAPELWQIDRLGGLRPHLYHLEPARRRVATAWLDHYEADVLRRLANLRTQTIHGDFNPANLLVDPEYPDQLAGVIDFGDMTTGPLVADLAIAAAYQCLGSAEPAAMIAEAAAGYHRLVPLTLSELEIIPELAMSRLVQSLIISGWRSQLHVENSEYILIHTEPVWEAVQRIGAIGTAAIAQRVAERCGMQPAVRSTIEEALNKRHTRLSKMRLTYDEPLRITSGSGVWLTDAEGKRYLDAYNNVAHVGHSHPDVVTAMAAQARRLNTNTRYLVDDVAAYADRLALMLPDPLGVVLFANSGSEANDLAWRIARTVTGRRGMIVTDHAYHGSTYLTMATSPEELGVERLEAWVATIPAPNGPHPHPRGLDEALEKLISAGEQPAAFACDTVFSSDGIFEAPPGYLSAVFDSVRRSGGLCIADEVQAGFGRVGTNMWGFVSGGIVPDIVTLGKPMGNGHPLAAVVTTADIAEEFFRHAYYFSTFAGNPVSVAVGNAVLDVMQRGRLAEQADRVGDYMRTRLRSMGDDHPSVGEVRGPGMFIGVEITNGDGTPAPEAAKRVQNRMREEQVLIGRTGIDANVLKIRPPLVFAESHADQLLAKLDLCFADDVMR